MTKEKILSVFEDINLMYNNPNMYDVLSKMLDELVEDSKKSVEPERKTGKWIDGKCNRCGKHAPFWAMSTEYHCGDYCPNCGAKMEVEV